ncbi:MAG: sulfurtransferase-like selenium metabolism protein YedF [Firmicutes bacterium]|jgi:selenium metabolism protein YedF|nr:sulfurtransferase-like selenium metabolism protein YedF [Bacillota bacterium]
MKEIIVDSRGLPCPQPVILAKKALADLQPQGSLISIVDNEVAKENVRRFASKEGLKVIIEEKEDLFYLTMFNQGDHQGKALPKLAEQQADLKNYKNEVIFLSSNRLGSGSDELGDILMKSFFYTLTQSEELMPKTMVFMNSAVYLLEKDGPLLEDLKALEKAGVEIVACGTCLEFYGLKERLALGRISNMYEIYEILAQSPTLTV